MTGVDTEVRGGLVGRGLVGKGGRRGGRRGGEGEGII